MEDKLLIICTYGPENPEKSTLAFVLANGALSTDVKVTVILQANAVLLAKKGEAEKVSHPGLMPMGELMKSFIELEGELLLCNPCVKNRGLTSDELLPESKLIAAGTVVDEVMRAKSVVTY